MSFAVAARLSSDGRGTALSSRSHPQPDSAVLVVGSITRADVPALCERLRRLVGETGVHVVACDVSAVGADLVAIDALAHLQLTARRLGCRLGLQRSSHELQELLELCGLAAVLRCEPLRR